MSFPGIFRRLFQKEGAGPLLRKEILPPHADTHTADGGDPLDITALGGASAEELAALQEALATLAGRFDAGGKVKAANLPPATSQSLGVVRIGGGLKVTAEGLLSADNTAVTAAGGVKLHIRQDGNDLNSGLEDSASGALKTPQAALEKALSLDMRQHQLTISLGTGTWDASGLALPNLGKCALPPVFMGQGDGTVLTISGGSNANFTNRPGSWWAIRNLKFALSGSVRVQNISGYVDWQNVSFTGTTTGLFLFMGNGSTGTIANCRFSGSALAAIGTNSGGELVMLGNVTINGTYQNVLDILHGGLAVGAGTGARFLGNPTGRRYHVAYCGVLDTNVGGPNFVPGTTPGVISNGGIYV